MNSTAADLIQQNPKLPWAQLRGMRNIAILEYFFVDLGNSPEDRQECFSVSRRSGWKRSSFPQRRLKGVAGATDASRA
jgi:hypothetical protein